MNIRFSITPQMQEYFNSLPKVVQESLVQSGLSVNSLDELKEIARSFGADE